MDIKKIVLFILFYFMLGIRVKDNKGKVILSKENFTLFFKRKGKLKK